MKVLRSALGDHVLVATSAGSIVESLTHDEAKSLARALLIAADLAEEKDRRLRESWAIARGGKEGGDT